jgi:hypothetical protein
MDRHYGLALVLACAAACSTAPVATSDASVDALSDATAADATVSDATPADGATADGGDATAARATCAAFCARAATQCGAPAPVCEVGCLMATATASCAERFAAYAACASTGSFDCASNRGPAACAALEAAWAPCASGGTPATPDAGAAPLCASFCDRGLAECRTGDRDQCLSSCAAGLVSPCGAQVRTAFTCAAANTGWACMGSNPFAPACASAVEALGACMARPPDAGVAPPDA